MLCGAITMDTQVLLKYKSLIHDDLIKIKKVHTPVSTVGTFSSIYLVGSDDYPKTEYKDCVNITVRVFVVCEGYMSDQR